MNTNPKSMMFDAPMPQWTAGELNPLLDAPGLPADVAKLIERHTKAFFAWKAAETARKTAVADVDRVRQRDRLDAALAVADGKPVPAADTIASAEQALGETRRVETAHREGLAAIEQRIRAAMRAAAPKWLPLLDREYDDARTTVSAALDQLGAAVRRQNDIGHIRGLVAKPDGKWNAPVSTDYAHGTVMDSVRQLLDEHAVQVEKPRFDTTGGTNFYEANTRAELDAAGF